MPILTRSLAQAMRAVALLAASACFCHGALAASVAEIKARGYLSVATEDDYAPFEFVENGKQTGYDNELKALLAKQIGLEIRQQVMPWAGILPGVTTGKYDMALSAVLVTEERKKVFDFASPTCESTTYFLTKQGSSIQSAEDLVGKVVGAETGSAMLADLKAFDAALKQKHGGAGLKQIVEYQGYPEAYQDLAVGRIDAVANTEISLFALMRTRPGTFAIGHEIGKPTYIAWAIKKGNPELVKLISDALLALRKNGQMYALQKKWLGASFEHMPESVN